MENLEVPEVKKEYLTVKELSLKLNVPIRTIEKWNINKRVQGTVKFGRQYRYKIATVEKAILNGQLLKH